MDERTEIDARARAMLAETAPQNWDEARRRLAVVRRYVAQGDRSVATVDEYAAQAGIGRSLFYRLARIYSKGTMPLEGDDAKKGAGNDPDPATDLTARAIVRAGPSASGSQVYRTVMELSDAEGIAAPSRRKVRDRTIDLLAGQSIATRMGLIADFAIDRAVLDIDVGGGSPPRPAQLVCVVDIKRGKIVRHLLSADSPSSDQVVSLVRCEGVRDGLVAISESDATLLTESVRAAIVQGSGGIVIGRWQTGTAIRAVAGLKIGKLALLARMPKSAQTMTRVDFDTASHVIDQLLEPYGDGG